MNVSMVKKAMLTMTQDNLSEIIHYAKQIKTINAEATFKVGQKVFVVQKTKSTSGIIIKMNTKKAVIEMQWAGKGLQKVNVPYAMLKSA